MTFALIEVEATAKKAARGAGYSWGMAEEAAKATRWLCAAGIDGVAVLARVLARTDGAELGNMAPSELSGDWRAPAGEICALMAGAALSDSAFDWAEGGKRIDTVIAPAMLLPFAALAARELGTVVTVEWDGARAATDGTVASLSLDRDGALFETNARVSIRSGGRLDHPLTPARRASPTENDWAFLTKLAQRTYAPDTEESRLKGAGAGLTDND